MRVTIKDIAATAGVSATTVSRILNSQSKKYRISEKTANIVRKTAKELNYRPNQMARSLRLKRTHSIGLVVPDIANPFFAQVTKSIQTQAYKFGYSTIVCNTDDQHQLEKDQIDLLISKGVDGLIVMPVGIEYKHLESIRGEGIHLVLMDRVFDDVAFPSVVVDNYAGAHEAVSYLIGKGHRRIGIIQGIANTSTNKERARGYKDALRRHGLEIDNNLISGNDYTRENGYIETKLLLSQNDPVTAIFTTSDLITIGALEAIFEENLNIPEDISIVSFDDIEIAPFLVAPLTAVHQPKRLMGEMAVKMLLEYLEGNEENPTKKIVLKPNLIERASVSERIPVTS
ncbi:MAG: LacI family transcriptional regulator [Candidatus Marinimicrobia bacterium]|nr:LacI family transcriptional regulator [Candidatus Neomarinimicrobiota bacterium]MCF7850908.1 LacI family transcriptional regulator [Candidatus Neomarinimicrobiota bacterium]MCF7905124.1 LacI family transcriptional regulator [Candidatus Neomarinimicrobiota bacterium]